MRLLQYEGDPGQYLIRGESATHGPETAGRRALYVVHVDVSSAQGSNPKRIGGESADLRKVEVRSVRLKGKKRGGTRAGFRCARRHITQV